MRRTSLIFLSILILNCEGGRIIHAEMSGPLKVNPIKAKLQRGEPVFGVRISTGDPSIIATVAQISGIDFLWIDREHHASLQQTGVLSAILATRGSPVVPFVRYKSPDKDVVGPDLDLGALGVVFAFTDTETLAKQAVSIAKYPPIGKRGFGPDEAAKRWGFKTSKDYRLAADALVMVIAMIETPEGVANVDAIASVKGIDAIFIGAYDLSSFLGVPGELDDPKVQAAIDKVLQAGKAHNIPVGYPVGTAEEANKLIAKGFRMFHIPSELTLLQTEIKDFLSQIKK